MIENEKNPDIAQVIPLQDKNAPENFYAGADRGEVLLRMTKELEQGAALLVLTGEEGSGKTMICRLLEREASGFCFTVFLTKSAESFEDVVKKMAMWLGLASDGGYEGKNVERVLDNITAHLKRESTGLLLIFDEAENIYLATLERIRKMLDRFTQAGARVHIVFSGRKSFLDNYAQLSILDFENSDHLQFDLMPLSEQETGEYLHAYAMDTGDSDRIRVFNDEIVRKIFSLAKGNFRKTNLLAEESLRTHGDDTSFMVLLENVKDEVGVKQRRRRKERPNVLKRSAHYLPWMGGIGCVMVLLFFLLKPGGSDQNEEKAQPAEKVEVVETQKAPEEKQAEEQVRSAPQVATAPQPEAQIPDRESLRDNDAAAENNPSESLSAGPADTEKMSGAVEEKPRKKAGVDMVREIRGTPENKAVPPPVSVQVSTPTAKVMQIRQEKPVKIKKVLASDKGAKAAPSNPPAPQKESTAAKNQLTIDQLLQKRMAAGSAWTKKGKEDAYTMQLMALTDKNAEDNLKKMLAQPQYRQEAGNFFIFKKTAASTIVFVFYGEYSSLAMAREAQDHLPPVLRSHQPYAISIKGAMEKVKK
ncbi:MAG: hypothetical protein A2X81_16425 [Desulfobacterales bacterium GWB2_56_26]|nr:MAG: hypothetical protein A2X81_16425 [Desulfobacterales bacterium GWB2_56_26]